MPALAIGGLAARTLLDAGSDAPEGPAGIGGGDWRSNLPHGVLRAGAAEASVLASALTSGLRGQPGSAPEPTRSGPLGQALASWQALEQATGVAGDDGMFAASTGNLIQPATVWPLGQALNAALDLAAHTGDWHDANAIMNQLAVYERGGAWSPGIWTAKDDRLWDDNAWLALDLLQAWRQSGDRSYIDRIEQMMPFLEQGIRADGGVWWQENHPNMSVNTCSTAPTAQVLLGMYEATGEQRYLDLAKQVDEFLYGTLQRPDGLFVDNITADGKVDPTPWSYNQGTPIGVSVQLYRATGDAAYLERARRTADAVLRWASEGNTLWAQPPSFNAIMFRNLLELDAVAPDPRIRALLGSYLDRAWREARNPATGIFDQGGIGRYDDGPGTSTLDQAAMVQMYAMLARG